MEDMQKNRVSHMILDLNKENPFQECVWNEPPCDLDR
jgi:hypothetical protein